MMKRQMLRCAAGVLLIVLAGCGIGRRSDNMDPRADNVAALKTNLAADPESDEKALDFMVKNYGFTEEELSGIDIEALIDDYRLESYEYTREEILDILEDMGDYYKLSPVDKAFSILGDVRSVPADSPGLPEDPNIARMAFYINPGTLQKRLLFDFEEHVYYVDDEGPYVLMEDQCDDLKSVLNRAGVSSWDHYYENTMESETTGSLRWKLVIILKDGTACFYGGYTRDMNTLPDTFSILEKALTETTESVPARSN